MNPPENYERLIQDIFKTDIQVKRLNKELSMLRELKKEKFKLTLQSTNTGLNILVDVEWDHNEVGLNEGRPIRFLLRLDSKFPFAFPRVHALSALTQNPTLSDGRDYLEDIINRPWSPSILLYEIVQNIPEFLQSVYANRNDKLALLNLGKYYLDQEYDIEDMELLEEVEIFPCKELLQNNKTVKKYLQVSRGFIVMYDYVEKTKSTVILSQYQPLSNLLNIRRKSKNDDTIVIAWKDEQYKDGKMQVINVHNCDACIDTIITNMKKQGVKVSKNDRGSIIPECDVTLEHYQTVDINQITNNIKQLEENLENEQLSNEIINSLMELYQQAIEYYSAFDESVFEQYVKKLKDLMARQDVQDLMFKKKEEPQEFNQLNE